MSQTISPYALLCACKPKPAPTVVTAYDLYSAAQQPESALSPAATSPLTMPSEAAPLPASAPSVSFSSKRTHYIADIKSRHNQALKKTVLS